MSVLRRFDTAELVLTQRMALEKPLLALVLLGTISFSIATGEAGYLLLIMLGVGVNALALRLRSEIYLPRYVVNAAVLLATLLAARDAMHTAQFFITLGHYLMLILFCKLFERKRNRDYAQLIAISVVLVLDSALLTIGIWFGVVLLLFVPLGSYVAMILTLKISLDRQAQAVLSAEKAPVDPRRLVWTTSGPFPRRALLRWTLYSSIGGLLTAVVVFLVMPRVQPGSLFSVGQVPFGGFRYSGFGRQNMNLTEVGRITADRRVVMDVKLNNRAGENLGRLGQGAYLRGAVYGNYSDGHWNVLGRERLWLRDAGLPAAPNEVIQHVTMDPSLLPSLFALSPVLTLEEVEEGTLSAMSPDVPGAPAAPLSAVRYVAYSCQRPFTPAQRDYLRIRHQEIVLPREGVANPRGRGFRGSRSRPAWPGGGSFRPREGGPSVPTDRIPARVAELAKNWCQDLLDQRQPLLDQRQRELAQRPPDAPGEAGAAQAPPDREIGKLNLAIAQRLVDRLHEGYTYTLDLSAIPPDSDPVEAFLFETRQGHCEFFASAMTLMARSLGVEARMIGGFLADDYSPTSKSYTVRAADAHAWVEVYTNADDWTLLDPTPGGGREAVQSQPKGTGPRDLWNRIRFVWNTRVLGYGEADRQNLFGRFLTWFRESGRRAGAAVRQSAQEFWRLAKEGKWDWSMLAVALPGLAAGGLLLALVLLVRFLRRRRLRRAQRADLRAMPAFYRRLAKQLARKGLPQQQAQTAQEYLLEAQRRYDLPPRSVAAVVQAAYRQRWAGAALPADQAATAQAAAEDIRQHLRKGVARSQ